jgi:hypothetical protein
MPKLIKLEMKKGILEITNEIQSIMRKHFENIYSKKLENLEVMNKFLGTFDLPKLKQGM